jgi:hypothetical protein
MAPGSRSLMSWGVQVTAVELVPSVKEAFPYFFDDAADLLRRPNGKIVIDDGRRFLQRTDAWYFAWALPFVLVEPDPHWRRFLALFSVVTVAQWAAPLDPMTTVLGDAWAAWRIWKLPRPARAGPLAHLSPTP